MTVPVLYGPDRVPIDNFMMIVKLQVPLYPAWHSQASNLVRGK